MPADKIIESDWQKMLQAADFSQSLAEREQTHRGEMRRILLDFLEVLDALERLIALGDASKKGSLVTLRRQMVGAFERAGIRFFDSVGQPFDPHRHMAIETRVDADQAQGIIVEEIRRGCEWDGGVLRSAQVVVAE